MTPLEKAKDLLDTYRKIMYPIIDNKNYYHGESLFSNEMAKECALIAVAGILNANPHTYIKKGGSDPKGDWSYQEAQSNTTYWLQVKKELENL